MSPEALNKRVRLARWPKPVNDPTRALDTVFETEPGPEHHEDTFTIFLVGAECPFSCVFCDLWKYTLDGPTPPGAIPEQIRGALREIPPGVDLSTLRVKLYNASNFFDERAVPSADDAEIAELLAPVGPVTVENHPKLTGPRVAEFAERLGGRLEVAMGLETVNVDALEKLNKQSTVDAFDRAAGFLAEHEIDLRTFVLLGAPYQNPDRTVEWAVRSATHAFRVGSRFVALNPVRAGNGFMESLEADGVWRPPTLREMEAALAEVLRTCGPGLTVVDLWEIEGFVRCETCGPARIENLRLMNQTQEPLPSVRCAVCDA